MKIVLATGVVLMLAVLCGCETTSARPASLTSEDPSYRVKRVVEIERTHSYEDAPELIELLYDSDMSVRQAAYNALEKLMREKGIDPVPEYYAADPVHKRRMQAEALQRAWETGGN